MKILIAEYASAAGMGGTCELEGRAMLATLAKSFARAGHDVTYPTSGPTIETGLPILIKGDEEFERVLDASQTSGS
ncbi:MAG: hypothetical protein LUO89_00145 [Methanothrix sp.]|nr:hypothetical protein [Methanothrix sp.]